MSLSQTILKYPRDLTGVSPFNLVQDERHSVPRVGNRAFAIDHGPLFNNSVVVRPAIGGSPLTVNQDYRILEEDHEASMDAASEVSWVIWITNPNVWGELSVDYQTLGGDYSISPARLQLLIDNLQIDNRSVSFDNLIDVPIVFPPSPHRHPANQIDTWDDLVDAVREITAQLAAGSQGSFDEINLRLDALQEQINQINNRLNIDFTNAINDLSNQLQILRNRVTVVENNLTALINRVNKLRESLTYISMNNNGVMYAGAKYSLNSDGPFTVQSAAVNTYHGDALKVGDFIEVITPYDIKPIFQVANSVTELLKYKTITDTSARMSGIKRVLIVYRGSGLWEIIA